MIVDLHAHIVPEHFPEANGRGGLDNITAIVVHVTAEEDPAADARTQELSAVRAP